MYLLCSGGDGVGGFFAIACNANTDPHCHSSHCSHSLLGGDSSSNRC